MKLIVPLLILSVALSANPALIFVSASMPGKDLYRLAVLAQGKQARLVVSSPKCWGKTTLPLWIHLARQTGAAIDINPQLFKQHGITQVPVAVIHGAKYEGNACFTFLCQKNLGCLSDPIDNIIGNERD